MKVLTRMIRNLFGLSGTDATESDAETEGSEITVEREVGREDTEAEVEEAEESETEAEAEEAEEAETEAEVEEVEEAETEETVEEDAEEGAGDAGESVEELSGIGPTYSKRLGAAGLGTIGALAESDPETVAEAAETSESRAEEWIEQAVNW